MPLDKDALENLRIDRSTDARRYGSIPRHLSWIAGGPRLLITGITYALILASIGGLLPGIRAARLPITAGLREL